MPGTPPPPALLQDAERALRRGELHEAVAIFRSLLAREPGSLELQARIRSVESLLQPREVGAGRPPSPPTGSLSFERPPTLEQVAEALFDRGDYAGAVSTYQRVLQARPDHLLARERLEEIRAVAQHQPADEPRATELPLARDRLYEELLARIASRRRG